MLVQSSIQMEIAAKKPQESSDYEGQQHGRIRKDPQEKGTGMRDQG